MKKSNKKIWYIGFIVLVLVLTIYFGARNGDFSASVRAILDIPVFYFILCALCVFGAILMQSLSAWSALKTLGHPMSIKSLYAIAVLGEFYCFVTPGASGGQPMQLYQFHKRNVPVGDATAALTVHYHCFTGALLVFDLLFGALYFPFIREQLGANIVFLYLGFAVNTLLLILMLLIAYYQRPIRWILSKTESLMRRFHIGNPEKLQKIFNGIADGFYIGMHKISNHRSEVIRQMAFAAVRLILMMSIVFFICHGLGQQSVSYGKLIAMGIMQYTSAAYTPLPGASGAQEGIFSLYFAGLLPESLLLSGLLSWRFFTYYLILIVGSIVVTTLGMRNTTIAEAEAEVLKETDADDSD